MTFSSLQNKNPFLLPLIVLALTYWVRHSIAKQKLTLHTAQWRRRIRSLPLWTVRAHQLLLLIALSGTILFELYFHTFQCQVSSSYYKANLELGQAVIALLLQHKLHVWLDYATLLNQLRQSPIAVWDHDNDVSLVHPAFNTKLNALQPEFRIAMPEQVREFSKQHEVFVQQQLAAGDESPSITQFDPSQLNDAAELSTTITSVAALRALFESKGYQTTYTFNRDLLQVWSLQAAADHRFSHNNMPHVDIWLWVPSLEQDRSAYEQEEEQRKRELEESFSSDEKTRLVQQHEADIAVSRKEQFTKADVSRLRFHSADHLIHYNARPAAELFPLNATSWLGHPVFVPAEAHKISEEEFSHYGGSYMQSQVFRGDCFHNLFNARWAW